MKFELGKLVSTNGVASLMESSDNFSAFVYTSLASYTECSWGDMCEEDSLMNDNAVKSGDNRIHGSYSHPENNSWKIWIITEWDRSVTTILFPSEY